MRDTPSSSEPDGPRTVREAHGTLVWTLDARVQDISLAGMQLETHTRLVPHRHYTFRLGHERSTIVLGGQVVWSFLKGTERTGRSEVQPVYRAGIEFDGVLTEPARELLAFLEANAIVTIETRLFGRFGLQQHELIHLDTRAEFRVAHFDLDGLVIESESAPDAGTICELELELAAERLAAQARVEGIRRLEETDLERSEVRLAWLELDPASRQAVIDFLANNSV